MAVYIIDRIEHGNGGVMGTTVLDHLPLAKALKKTPYDYDGCGNKMFGFYPVIARGKDANKPLYVWDDRDRKWVKVPQPRAASLLRLGQEAPLSDDEMEKLLTRVLQRIEASAKSKGDWRVLRYFGQTPEKIAKALMEKTVVMCSLFIAFVLRSNSAPLIVLGWFADLAIQVWGMTT